MAKNIETPGGSGPAAALVAPLAAPLKRKSGGQRKEGWEAKFLELYALDGNLSRAAKAAGVSHETVRKREADNAVFSAQVKAAKEEFVDALEELLLAKARSNQQQSVIAILARLKAERPQRWNDKLQIDGAVKHLHAVAPVTPELAFALLREMLGDATEATRVALAGAADVSVVSGSVGSADMLVPIKEAAALPAYVELADFTPIETAIPPSEASKPA